MSAPVRAILGGAVALAVAFGIAALGRVPYATAGGDASLLRLSWRVSGAAALECRPLSEEERARTPVHMRRTESCERRVPPRRLRVRLNGVAVMDTVVRAAGRREDGPLYVHRELWVAPGRHEIEVRFAVRREEGRDEHEADELDREEDDREDPVEGGRYAPDALELRRAFEAGAGEVALVTYDPDARELELRTPPGGAP